MMRIGRAGVQVSKVIDVAVTLVMGVAAVLIIWRTLASPSAPGPLPGSPVQDVAAKELVTSIAHLPVKGDQSARAVIIEFSDFECPFCRRHNDQTFEQIDRELIAPGHLRYAFSHFPLERVHPHASDAARAADCADAQGKFWEMRRHLFSHQQELRDAVWLRDAREIGLDEGQLALCLSAAGTDKVAAQQTEAKRLGTTSTPTFLVGLVDGGGEVRVHRRIEGAHPFEVYRDAVNEVLASK